MVRILPFAVATALACSGAPAARADAAGLDLDPLRFLADCLGRVSAERAHLDAFGDAPGEARARAMRHALADLVAAMTPSHGADRVLAWRAEARAAQVALLTRATLEADPHAAALAEDFVARCAGMIVLPDEVVMAEPG
jgi:hypothetical protein